MKNLPVEVSKKARHIAVKYLGEEASRYEEKRAIQTKWKGEDRKVKEFLNDLPKGTSLLDIPCGTGRFFPYYEQRGFKVMAMDISPDMLAQARNRATSNIIIEKGSIFNIETCLFHVVLCVRFLNLIEAEDVKLALSSIQSVARFRVIFTLREKWPDPTNRLAHPMSLIEKSLLPGWKINRNEQIHDKDYRLIELVK